MFRKSKSKKFTCVVIFIFAKVFLVFFFLLNQIGGDFYGFPSDVSPSFQFSKCGLFSSVFVASLCQTTYKREDFDSTTMHPP